MGRGHFKLLLVEAEVLGLIWSTSFDLAFLRPYIKIRSERIVSTADKPTTTLSVRSLVGTPVWRVSSSSWSCSAEFFVRTFVTWTWDFHIRVGFALKINLLIQSALSSKPFY